ncbi:ABC transporter permease [Zoogloea sp.]|uniref:ABC transporter permease n=1 Tax=Zoogloea sp. TaxID=49181 RepID=UPI00262A561C|nr:ABC transporter permease [Zoogloea sp.]MDD3352403.1 ABC transporter permease [Zoogloea sp.]
MNAFSPPCLTPRLFAVWRRNFLVWRKLALPSIVGNLADPVIYMLGLGYGLGLLVPEVEGVSYIAFLAGGTLAYSTMNAATFEVLYSGFSRMHVQKTWDAIMNAPVALDDIVAAELLWAASKATLAGTAILAVIALFGFAASPLALAVIPVIFLTGLCFAAVGLIMTAVAPSYDFFMYYFTLFITPMTLLSGVFFPQGQLPDGVRVVAELLPLSHAVSLARPLLLGQWPSQALLHGAALLAITLPAFWLALALTRRRLLK